MNKVIENLKSFYESENEKIMLITGVWGVGKTHQVIDVWASSKDIANIYKLISLFGCEKIDNICWDLLVGMSDKQGKTLRGGIIEVLKLISSLIGKYAKLNISLDSIFKYVVANNNKFNFTNTVLIIDDIERKSDNIALKEILNWIESVKKQFKKIVLIMDDTKLCNNDIEYLNKYYEKIIDRNFCIKVADETAKKEILKSLTDEEMEKLDIGDVKNLRTLEKLKYFIELANKNSNFKEKENDEKLLIYKLYLFSYRKIKNNEFSTDDYIESLNTPDMKAFYSNNKKSAIEKFKDEEKIKNDMKYEYSHYSDADILSRQVNNNVLFNKIIDLDKHLENVINYIKIGDLDAIINMKVKFDICPLEQYENYDVILSIDELKKVDIKIRDLLNSNRYDPMSLYFYFINCYIFCGENIDVDNDWCREKVNLYVTSIVELIYENKYKYEYLAGLKTKLSINDISKKFHI